MSNAQPQRVRFYPAAVQDIRGEAIEAGAQGIHWAAGVPDWNNPKREDIVIKATLRKVEGERPVVHWNNRFANVLKFVPLGKTASALQVSRELFRPPPTATANKGRGAKTGEKD